MTLTLLAVDDSKTMRKVLEITFAGEDYRMVLAESASEAVAKLRSEHPNVALVDAILGSDSGYDLCQQLKREAPNLGVLILGSKQHPYDRARGAQVHADDFIDKPFDTQALIDKVAALGQRLAAGGPAARPEPAPAVVPTPAVAVRPIAAAVAPAPRPAAPVAAAPGAVPAAPMAVAAPVAPAKPAAPVAPAQPAAPMPAAAPAAVASPAAVATAVLDASLEAKLAPLGLTREQMAGVISLSREVVEQVVWEVVPVLAETMIREEIARLTAE